VTADGTVGHLGLGHDPTRVDVADGQANLRLVSTHPGRMDHIPGQTRAFRGGFRLDESGVLTRYPQESIALSQVRDFDVIGDRGACAVHESGRVSCLYDNERRSTTREVPELGPAEQVAASFETLCARSEHGVVKCMRFTAAGDGWYLAPQGGVTTVYGVHGATGLAGHDEAFCAAIPNEGVRCWGSVGDLAPQPPSSPTATHLLPFVGAFRVAIGGDAVCALSRAGFVRCWATHPNWSSEVPTEIEFHVPSVSR
jgi:hypothetical protein